jgi:hypothetical protein
MKNEFFIVSMESNVLILWKNIICEESSKLKILKNITNNIVRHHKLFIVV